MAHVARVPCLWHRTHAAQGVKLGRGYLWYVPLPVTVDGDVPPSCRSPSSSGTLKGATMRLATIGLIAALVTGAPVRATPDSHEQAAAELLDVINLRKTMTDGASVMVDAMIQGNASLAPYRDVLQKWTNKIMTWDALGPKMIALYAESFTEAELREMTAFYRTPTGKKAVALMPELMRRGALLGAEVAKEHTHELEQMVRERASELERSK